MVKRIMMIVGRGIEGGMKIIKGEKLDMEKELKDDEELKGKILKSNWILREKKRIENMEIKVVKGLNRMLKNREEDLKIVMLDKKMLMDVDVIEEKVMKLERLELRREKRRIERRIEGKEEVNGKEIVIDEIKIGRDMIEMIRVEIEIVERMNIDINIEKIEEKEIMVGGSENIKKDKRKKDILMDRRIDKKNGIGGKKEEKLRIEKIERMNEEEIEL